MDKGFGRWSVVLDIAKFILISGIRGTEFLSNPVLTSNPSSNEIKWNFCSLVLKIAERSYTFVKVLFKNTDLNFDTNFTRSHVKISKTPELFSRSGRCSFIAKFSKCLKFIATILN